MAMLFMPIIANILFIPFPPFGIATCASLGLASFVFYVGLYSSAISLSEDAKLLKTIRRTALNELKLLDSIGTAQMIARLEDKVVGEVGVQPSLSEEDVKQYLDDLLKELDKRRNQK